MSQLPYLPIDQGPRVVVYYQTHHKPGTDQPVGLIPLLSNNTGITHVIVAAIHINGEPEGITINDDPPDAERNNVLWSEVAWIQASGIKVLGMLGGAAKGSYERLGGHDLARFEAFYTPLRDLIRRHKLDGLDLDIEEHTTLPETIRLIDRLRADFGPSFLITLAPVATALFPGGPHLSGPAFDYRMLESLRGNEIAWYNTQFYCGWGDASTTAWYDAFVSVGWKPEKVVMGLVTNPSNGAGFVPWSTLENVLRTLRVRYPRFGGVMGWEYFNAMPGDLDRPWEWVKNMSSVLRTPMPAIQDHQLPMRPVGVTELPIPPSPFPAEDIKTLQDLGFSAQQAMAALNMTGGNVEYAAGMLFQE